MFSKIVVPVDLAHADKLDKALRVAANLAREYDAEVCYIGVTPVTPSSLAHTPEEYAKKLTAFATQEADLRGIKTGSHMLVSHDPSAQMDRELEKAVEDLGADLVVAATHAPNVTDYVWSGHGAYLAAHSNASVMVVRP